MAWRAGGHSAAREADRRYGRADRKRTTSFSEILRFDAEARISHPQFEGVGERVAAIVRGMSTETRAPVCDVLFEDIRCGVVQFGDSGIGGALAMSSRLAARPNRRFLPPW
jgi:hypothetical protein